MQTRNPENCPRCGKRLKFALSKAAPGRSYQCLDCDGGDPLQSPEVQGWLNSELAKSADKSPKK
jgi:hypothetical protein